MIMSLKLLKLRWKIFFWTVTGRMQKIRTRLKVKLVQGNSENVLIVFPMDEPSFRVAIYAFRDLGKNDETKRKFIFLIKEQFRQLFHLQMGEAVFIEVADPNDILSDEKFIMQSIKQKHFESFFSLGNYPPHQFAVIRSENRIYFSLLR